jgi:hypothetical protein
MVAEDLNADILISPFVPTVSFAPMVSFAKVGTIGTSHRHRFAPDQMCDLIWWRGA